MFSALLLVALVLVREAVGDRRSPGGAWLTDSANRKSVQVALGLLPFGAIAFLWFIGVVRDRVGDREDPFFASVFLGSGLLLLAMLLAAAALAGGVVANAQHAQAPARLANGGWGISRHVMGTLLNERDALGGVLVVSTSTILSRVGTAPRWLTVSGYVVAAVLLFVVGVLPWVEVVFPVWVMLNSVHILRADVGRSRTAGAGSLRGS